MFRDLLVSERLHITKVRELKGLTFKSAILVWTLVALHFCAPAVWCTDNGGDQVRSFYVSTTGDDRWGGSLPEQNPDQSDGPFATLQHARDVIRKMRSDGYTDQFVILIRGGTYELKETLILGTEDSGTQSRPLIIKAFPGEEPILSGGSKVGDFKPYRDGIYKAELKNKITLPAGPFQLFADGKRQIIARFPNFDFHDPIGGGFLYVENSIKEGDRGRFEYHKDSVPDWLNYHDAQVVIYSGKNWCNDTLPVQYIDKKSLSVVLAQDASYAILAGNRYYFQNIMEALDSPGEWFFDVGSKELYYWPEQQSSLKSVFVPRLKTIVEIKQNGYLDKYSSFSAHLRFEGITFEYCEGDTLVMRKAKNATIAGCTIRHAGGCGIVIEDGYENAIFSNDIYDIGNSGIIVSGGDRKSLTPAKNIIENNYVHNIGIIRKVTNTSGIYCEGVGNIVSHNLVHSTPRVGIWFDGNDHVIEYNCVHHVNQETQDSGIIASCARDWTKRGNVVRFNYLHDSGGYGRDNASEPWQSPFYTWGIYLDDYTSGTEVYGNIVANTKLGGIFIHGGRDNIVENNIISEGGTAQMVYSAITPSAEEFTSMFSRIKELGYTKYPLLMNITNIEEGSKMSGNRFVRNIISYTGNSILYVIYGSFDFATNISDYNTISHMTLPILVPCVGGADNLQWTRWKARGLDQNSVVADPLFSISSTDNFHLSPASPALEMGFNPIPFEKIGLYKDSLRDRLLFPPQSLKVQ